MLAVVAEVLAHGGAGVGGRELEGARGGVGDDDAVVQGSLLVKLVNELGDGRALLSHADVDAREGVGLGLLVDDGVHGDGSLAGLPVADDDLALAAADGDERVHGLDDAWELDLGTGSLVVGGDGHVNVLER